jgi:DNA (cytosine-5)-methyltransferase 1
MPMLLDLFCGAGGAAMGYYRAGFDVIGVDINPQPNYPFKFLQGDWDEALSYIPGLWERDGVPYAIHASPPCQAFSTLRAFGNQSHRSAPDLVGFVRERLTEIGAPYVIENVVGAPLWDPIKLCGSSFGLGVRRHRMFESSQLIFGHPCDHRSAQPPVCVVGDHPQQSGDHTYRLRRAETLAQAQEAMGIDWMPWKALTQAIPPAYTEWIGRQLLPCLSS